MPVNWSTAADWDAGVDDGTIHEAVANTDHTSETVVKRGYSAATPLFASNLYAGWLMHEDTGTTVYDHSGNARNLTITGTMGMGDVGLAGTTGYNFDGASAEAYNTGLTTPTGGGTTGMTMIWWAWDYDITLTTERRFFRWNPGGNGTQIYHDATGVKVNHSGTTETQIGTTISDVTYPRHHAVVWNPTATTNSYDLEWYWDGTLDMTTAGVPMQFDETVFYLGSGMGSNFYPGRMAGMWVYDRPLTATEVATHADVITGAATHTTSKKVS